MTMPAIAPAERLGPPLVEVAEPAVEFELPEDKDGVMVSSVPRIVDVTNAEAVAAIAAEDASKPVLGIEEGTLELPLPALVDDASVAAVPRLPEGAPEAADATSAAAEEGGGAAVEAGVPRPASSMMVIGFESAVVPALTARRV